VPETSAGRLHDGAVALALFARLVPIFRRNKWQTIIRLRTARPFARWDAKPRMSCARDGVEMV
jgi:hypothetical protein